ncbi:MAG TPA: hypothetical protein VM165_21785 [Planctomycetaceae bacterium]|nr:hypothetical protein [Planctomycetaceae bacterium]
MSDIRRWFTGGLVCAAAGLPMTALEAACPCSKGNASVMAVSQVEVGNGLTPIPDYGPGGPLPPLPAPMTAPAPPAMMSPTPIAPGMSSEPIGTAIPGTNRFGMAPPPGTLGKTYQRRTTLLPDEKHPRIGIVDVHVPENVDVTARGLKSKWTGQVWQLESEAPLLPGVPHIYAIKAEKTLPNGEKQVDVRWVRLIMGRVVDLEF